MSDYYGLPLPTPGGIVQPNLASLYPSLNTTTASPSMLSSLQSLLGRGGSGLAAEATPIFEGGVLASARRVAPPLIASQLATAGINQALPSTGGAGNVRQVLGDAATGAGVGASLGLLGGPFAELSVPAGALIGGAAGGLYGLASSLFGGEDKKPDYKQALADAASQAGLDPAQYTTAFDLLSKSGADEKTLSTQLAQQLLTDAATQKQQQQAIQIQQQQREGDQKFALAMQAQAQQFFTPYVNNIITAGQSEAELLKGQAASLPEPYRKVFEAQAQQALAGSQRLAGAYAAQSAMLPSQYMMSQDLQRQQQLAQLQYQQSVVNAQQGGGSSADFSSLVQQLAGQSGG